MSASIPTRTLSRNVRHAHWQSRWLTQLPSHVQQRRTAAFWAPERSPDVMWSAFDGDWELYRALAVLAAPGALRPDGDRPLGLQLCVPHGQRLPHTERTVQGPFLTCSHRNARVPRDIQCSAPAITAWTARWNAEEDLRGYLHTRSLRDRLILLPSYSAPAILIQHSASAITAWTHRASQIMLTPWQHRSAMR